MPCPASPEPDGFHRYAMAAQGDGAPTTYLTHCLHCGEEKQVRPPAPQARWADSMRKGNTAARAASNAAKRRKREETPG